MPLTHIMPYNLPCALLVDRERQRLSTVSHPSQVARESILR